MKGWDPEFTVDDLETVCAALGVRWERSGRNVLDSIWRNPSGCRFAVPYPTEDFVRLVNPNNGRFCTIVRKSDNRHTMNCGELACQEDPAVKAAHNADDNRFSAEDMISFAVSELLSGKTLRYSNTRRMDLPKSSSVDEFLLKLSLTGRAK